MKSINLIAAGLVSMLLLGSPAIADDLVVVINISNPESDISMDNLKKYYEGTVPLWGNGKKITPADLADGNPLAAKFSEAVLGKSLEKKQAMWVRKVFRGEGTPPAQFPNDAGVLNYVAENPGAIGYVTKGSVDTSVKIVSVDGKPNL